MRKASNVETERTNCPKSRTVLDCSMVGKISGMVEWDEVTDEHDHAGPFWSWQKFWILV